MPPASTTAVHRWPQQCLESITVSCLYNWRPWQCLASKYATCLYNCQSPVTMAVPDAQRRLLPVLQPPTGGHGSTWRPEMSSASKPATHCQAWQCLASAGTCLLHLPPTGGYGSNWLQEEPPTSTPVPHRAPGTPPVSTPVPHSCPPDAMVVPGTQRHHLPQNLQPTIGHETLPASTPVVRQCLAPKSDVHWDETTLLFLHCRARYLILCLC